MDKKNADVIDTCYLDGCMLSVYPGTYYCTRTHQMKDQENRYGRSSEHKVPLLIQEMQDKLKKMAQDARNKKTTGGIESSQG